MAESPQTALQRAFADAVRRDAVWLLRMVTPMMAVVFTVEALSHVVLTPGEWPLIVAPLGSAGVMAGVAVWSRRQNARTLPLPAMWMLVPWGLDMLSCLQHLAYGSVGGVVMILGATLVAVGAMMVATGPAVFAGIVTTLFLTWAAGDAFSQASWVFPALLAPIGAVLHVSRRRAVWESARRQLAEEQLAIERARVESVRRTQILATGFAHHFNNLLYVILGNAESLIEEVPERPPAPELVDMVTAGRRASALVQEMMALTGGMELQDPTEVSIEAVVRQAVGERAVQVEVRGAPRLRADEAALVKALEHVVDNAIEASEPSAVGVWVRGNVSGGITIEVEDPGEGIGEADLPHVFDPFFTTRGPARAGLGLAVARGVVEAHGGTISLSARPGDGTRVRILLDSA